MKIVLAVIGVLVCLSIVMSVMFINVMNREVKLRNTIDAKQRDNVSEFDNMWKKIAQTTEVAGEHKNALREIFISHATARTDGKGQGGSIASWVQESVPNVNLDTMNNLQNIIIGSRDSWTMRQKELLDLKREHDNLIDVFPSSVVCGILGREKIDVTIVVSLKAEQDFKSGSDNDIKLFDKN